MRIGGALRLTSVCSLLLTVLVLTSPAALAFPADA